jgi:hypothetical protein
MSTVFPNFEKVYCDYMGCTWVPQSSNDTSVIWTLALAEANSIKQIAGSPSVGRAQVAGPAKSLL